MRVVEHQPGNSSQIALRVIDRISAMIAYWDKDLICRFANSSYLEWFGRTSDEMIDKITLPELLGPLYEKNLPYISGVLMGSRQTFERDIVLPDGTIRHSLANYFPDTVGGETRGFFVHVADINALKQAEQKLTRSNELICAQNDQLINFANIVAHNLKSYSGNLSSLLDLFQQADDQHEKDQILRYLLELSKAFSDTVARLTDMVTEPNPEKRSFKQVTLITTVGNAISGIAAQIRSCEAQIKLSIDPDLKLITNPAYLESIVLNLVTNALKYRHPARFPLIDISAHQERNAVYLTVKDNGLGIDLERDGHLLFGMNNTFHGNPDAQGMGLYITKSQIKSLSGQIHVDSKVNQGSTFTVVLPIDQAGIGFNLESDQFTGEQTARTN